MKRFALSIIIVALILATATVASAAGPTTPPSTHNGLMNVLVLFLGMFAMAGLSYWHSRPTLKGAIPCLVVIAVVLGAIAFSGCAAKQLPPPKDTMTTVSALPKDCDPKRVEPLEKNKAIKEKELAAANKRLDSETARVNTENGRLQEEINTQQKELNTLVTSRPAQKMDKDTFEVLNKKEIEDHAIDEKKANYAISAKEAQIAANRVSIRNLIAQRDLIIQEVEKLTKQLQDELDCLSSRLGQKKLDMNNIAGDASKAPPVVVDESPPDNGKKK